MFTRLAAVAGALLVAGTPAMASLPQRHSKSGTVVDNGEVLLTARQVGRVVLNGKQADASRLCLATAQVSDYDGLNHRRWCC